MGLGLAGAAVDYFGQKKQLKGQLADARAAEARERQNMADARAGMEGTNYEVGPAYRQMLAMAKQDPVADALRAQASRQEAQNVGALKAGGARALIGGLSGVTQAAASNIAGIEADSFARQQAALGTYGAQEQRAQDLNTEKQLGLYEFDYGRSIQRGDEAEQAVSDLDAQRQSLNRDMLSGLLGIAGQTVGSGIMSSGGGVDVGGMFSNLFGGRNPSVTPEQVAAVNQGAQSGGANGDGDWFVTGTGSSANWNPWTNKHGGMVTPGEFSHETNPIDVVKDGEKIAELTGNEVVLNPKQEKRVAAESPYFRQLLKKFKADAKKRRK